MEENAETLKILIRKLYGSIAQFAREFSEDQPGGMALTDKELDTAVDTIRKQLRRDTTPPERLAQYFTYIKATDKFRESEWVWLDPRRQSESLLCAKDHRVLEQISREIDGWLD